VIVGLYLDGRFLLDEMVTKTYQLADIHQAVDDLHDGKLNRGVLTLI
jgi:Zn-dependent alcohol dehydrogenase